MLFLAMLVSPSFMVAQSATQPDGSSPPPNSQTAVIDPAATDANAQADQHQAGTMPTAAQVELEGERLPDPATVLS